MRSPLRSSDRAVRALAATRRILGFMDSLMSKSRSRSRGSSSWVQYLMACGWPLSVTMKSSACSPSTIPAGEETCASTRTSATPVRKTGSCAGNAAMKARRASVRTFLVCHAPRTVGKSYLLAAARVHHWMKAALLSFLWLAAHSAAPAQELTFEVASVKPNPSMSSDVSVNRSPGGGLDAVNVPARALITIAYSLRDQQLIGAPGWLDVERYDIHAKAPAGEPEAQFNDKSAGERMRLRLRALLAERFQ